LFTGPVAAVYEAALVLKFSQTALPLMIPPASSIRVTIVASGDQVLVKLAYIISRQCFS